MKKLNPEYVRRRSLEVLRALNVARAQHDATRVDELQAELDAIDRRDDPRQMLLFKPGARS